jgi:hypothetical protein
MPGGRQKKGLLSAAQHRRRGRPLTLTVHNVTTARDLVPPRKDDRQAEDVAQAPRESTFVR